jgi:hypothetical protein
MPTYLFNFLASPRPCGQELHITGPVLLAVAAAGRSFQFMQMKFGHLLPPRWRDSDIYLTQSQADIKPANQKCVKIILKIDGHIRLHLSC